MALLISRIRPEDWTLLRDLRLRSLLDAPDAFGQRYENAAAETDDEWQATARASSSGNRRVWFIARGQTGAAVGLVQARRRPETDCLLFSMWVAPESRRAGVGAALVTAVRTWAAGWGARRVVLWVFGANESAMRFYQHIGFRMLTEGSDAESGHAFGALAMELPVERLGPAGVESVG